MEDILFVQVLDGNKNKIDSFQIGIIWFFLHKTSTIY